MHTLILGYAKGFLTMFVKRKKNRSGTTSVVVAEKTKGIYKELITIGVAKDSNEIDSLVNAGHEWISKEESRRHPQLDLYGEEREACDREREEVRRVLSNVSNILLNLTIAGRVLLFVFRQPLVVNTFITTILTQISTSTVLVKVLHHLFEVFLCFHNSDFKNSDAKVNT